MIHVLSTTATKFGNNIVVVLQSIDNAIPLLQEMHV